MNAFSNIRRDGMLGVLNRVAGERQRYGLNTNSAYSPDIFYATDGLAQRIVDKPAEDAMSVGFSIDGDPNQDIINEFDRLGAVATITNVLRWSRLHGGGAVLVFVDDGLQLTDPIDLDRIKKIDDLIDYPASAMQVVTGYRYDDPTKKNYGWPSMYELKPKFGNPFMVHESRLILIPGDPLPSSLISSQVMPWLGRSALEACYVDIMLYKDALRLSKGILERKVQLVHKMSNLGEMLAQGMDEIVAKRLGIADSVRGVFNMLAVDALDDVVLADTQLGGISDVIKDFRISLCASSGLSQAILFGEQASGLNPNANAEKSIYQSVLQGLRTRGYKPAIERLAGMIWAQKSLGASEPQRWQTVLEPLSAPTPSEVADTELKEAQARYTRMQALQIGVETFIASPEDSRQDYANIYPELNVDVSQMPEIPDDPNPADANNGSGG